LRDRGVIRPGAVADVTIFDPNHVRDNYTITSPPGFPEGIPYVIVNGVPTVEEGRHTGALAGEVLHRGA
jgi:N-acyl-D-aspartate/D-glutamate deacylase